MRQLTIMQGLPGSGKTTWALEFIKACDPSNQRVFSEKNHWRDDPKIFRVNQDDIRRELGWTSWATWDFKSDGEKMVTPIKLQRIEEAFIKHRSVLVISDDTNLNPKVVAELEALAKRHEVYVDFHKMETSATECVRRDALRGVASVGAVVIYGMADKYRLTESSKEQTRFAKVTDKDRQSSNGGFLVKGIICDLDGTASLFKEKGHRGPYDASLCDQDEPNLILRDVLRSLERAGYFVLYVSGRYEQFRPQTKTFLATHQFPQGPLYMRRTGDTRKDWIIKGELFDAHIRGLYDVRIVFDDRNQVVNFWRSIGLTCWQVAEGDF